MRNHIFFVFLCTVLPLSISAKEGNKKKSSEETPIQKDLTKFYENLFITASELRDAESAQFILLALYALNPEDTSRQMDLLYAYFTSGKYTQSMFLGEKIYKKNDNNIDALDIWAKSQESAGNFSDAIINYELLYQRTKNSYYQYLCAFCQFQLFRYHECNKYLANVLKNPDIEERTVIIDYGEKQTQEVPLKAALLNLDGLVKMEMNQREAAFIQFNEALKVYPDFLFAKENIAAMQGQQRN